MRFEFRIYLLLFLFATSFVSGQNEIEIKEFKNVLGKDNYSLLTSLTSDFENTILAERYPNLEIEKAYHQFLTDIKDNDSSYYDNIETKTREKFKESDLRLEIYEFPDSVWIEGKEIKSRYVFKDGNGAINYGISSHSIKNTKNLDSLISAEYSLSRFKHSGKYLKAVEMIKNNSAFLEAYYDLKNSYGRLHPMAMANLCLKHKVDFSNDIIKRLIVIEYLCY